MNRKITIRLNTVERIKSFCKVCEHFTSNIDVYSGRYIVDGKSLIGIMSLNNLNDVQVMIDTWDEAEFYQFEAMMEDFK